MDEVKLHATDDKFECEFMLGCLESPNIELGED